MADEKHTPIEKYNMAKARDHIKESDLRQALLQIRDNQDRIVTELQRRLNNAAGYEARPYYPLKISLNFNQVAAHNNRPEAEMTGPIRLQYTDITNHQIFMDVQSLMTFHHIMMSCGLDDRDVEGEDGRTYESDFRADFTKAVVIFSHDIEKSGAGIALGSDNILEMRARPWPQDPNPDMRWTPPARSGP